MSLVAGTRLGPYEIQSAIGAGGMGEVYKARDTRLDRTVAIKVLPAELSADPDRRVRFEREARAIAALNHPHICTLHDIGTHEGTTYLVMEHLPGQTLADRVLKGPLPLAQALDIAVQIAEALDAAHKHGIVHRDLKPGNVMLTTGGAGRSGVTVAKLLDFGLAKLAAHGERPALAGGASVPTQAAPLTAEGTVLGTLQYMAPEQLEGKEADARTDLWALGAVLYEMVTGRRAFEGESQVSLIGNIMNAEPPALSTLQPLTPPSLDRLVKKCLAKHPDDRWDGAHDVADELRWLGDDLQRAKSTGGAGARSRPGAGRVAGYLLAAVAALGLVVAVTWVLAGGWRQVRPGAPMTAIPAVTYPGIFYGATLSPDGDRIAFSWNGPAGDNFDIYVRLVGAGEPLRLTRDPAAETAPAWSPDGKLIAFIRLMKPGTDRRAGVFVVPVLGGPDRRIAEIAWSPRPLWINFANLAWSPDGRWLVTTDRSGVGEPYALHLISVETGAKRQLTSPPARSWVGGDFSASFSPDGRFLTFVRSLHYGENDLYRIRLTGDGRVEGEPERLTHESRDIYSPVWTRDGHQVLYSSGSWHTSGRVVRRLDLSKPKGAGGYPAVQETFGEDAWDLAVSADGRRLAYRRRYDDQNIYRIGLPHENGQVGTPEKFIASTRNDIAPQYSPDGRTIAFTSSRSGSQEIWLCDADGANPRQLTTVGGRMVSNPSWSPDGKTLLYQSQQGDTLGLYFISAEGGPSRPLRSDVMAAEGSWSRDGRSIYFRSAQGSLDQVYRVPVSGGHAEQVTRDGGADPFEAVDGRWLYYTKWVEGHYAIWKVSPGGGEESEVHPGPVSTQNNFVVVDDGIYFTSGKTLAFIDFKRGTSKTICQVKNPAIGLTISPDRRWILCALGEEGLTDLMLVENFR